MTDLELYEKQSQETPLPYGGAPGEIQEEDEVPFEEDYGAHFDNQERCPVCNEHHAPPACRWSDVSD